MEAEFRQSTRRPNLTARQVAANPVATLCWLLPVLGALHLTQSVAADDPDNCLMCHQYRGLGRVNEADGRLHLYFVDPDYGHSALGPHARLACTDCHAKSEVGIVPHLTTTPVNCAKTCHLADPTGLERVFSHERAAAMLEEGVHSSAVLEKLNFSGGPLLNPGQSNCLYCHDEPLFRTPQAAIPSVSPVNNRVFDRCDTCHRETVPVDIEYYVKHIASRFQPARSTMGQAQVCAICHSDPVVRAEFEMSDAVASYVRSFHGKAALLGDTTTADCLSCHIMAGENAHLMLGPDHPQSSVNAVHIADSCRSTQCHPGADMQVAQTAVHFDLPTAAGSMEYALAGFFVIATALTFGPSALLVILSLVSIILGRGHEEMEHGMKLLRKVQADPAGRRKLIRFTVKQRIEHWLLVVLFTLLVLTGFPLKFADTDWASALIAMFGGLNIARHVHHWSGVGLLLGFAYHVAEILIQFVRDWRKQGPGGARRSAWQTWNDLPMWITFEDVRKTRDLMLYLCFLKKDRPRFGRFSPTEKFEYLGVFWGTVLLGITGFVLWGMQISTHFMSGRALNLATIAHTYEAFLALIHVGILHIYNVVLAPLVFPLSRATITGETPPGKLAEEHGELIEDVAHELGIGHATN